MLTNAITGMIGGGTAGTVSPVKGLRFGQARYAEDFLQQNVTIGNFTRSLLGAGTSNGNYNSGGAK